MADEGFKRKLAAILSADVEGYSRLMADNEEATAGKLKTYRKVTATLIQQHSKNILHYTESVYKRNLESNLISQG